MSKVLVLNADGWEPLSRTRLGRAISLVESGKAVVHAVRDDKLLTYAGGEMLWPTDVRLVSMVRIKVPRGPATWSKRGLMVRDGFKCAYEAEGCVGVAGTVDHVLPSSRGGESSWKNTVAACFVCNNLKANRTPEEAGLCAQWVPWTPSRHQLAALGY
jgi:hypothetical protein